MIDAPHWTVTGRVTRRREHGKKLLFFDVTVDRELSLPLLASSAESSPKRDRSGDARCCSTATVRNTMPTFEGREVPTFQVVHSMRCYPEGAMDLKRFKCLTKLVMPKAVVRVKGKFGRTKTQELSLFADDLQIVRVQPDPSAVVKMLCNTWCASDDDDDGGGGAGGDEGDSLFDVRYCAEALGGGGGDSSSSSEGEVWFGHKELVRDLQELMLHHPSQFRRECSSIARQLQGLPPHRMRSKPMKIQARDVALLDGGYSTGLREAYAVDSALGEEVETAMGALGGDMSGLLEKLIQNLPCLDPEEKRRRELYMREKKWPQILWIASQVERMLGGLRSPEGGGSSRAAPVRIADVGAGRGDLSLALALKFRDCQFVVIDVNESSLNQGKALAARLKIKNVTFLLQDVKCISRFNEDFDLFIGLHACGGLTDAILEQVSLQRSPASFLICTCCFGKNKDLRPEAFAPAFGRHGEEGCERTLCRLADCQEHDLSSKAMHAVNAGRLRVLEGLVGSAALACTLKAFPRRWSSKNMVLCGEHRSRKTEPLAVKQ
ncbi:putative methyltransferase [Chloropicon primus]|uniref:Putative methyltransferase n=2 Tax=Chloropicon primus TaxID=1764295 RepID=A0A5B8MNJ1_9CHLO|nr:putative methyltransferase [Chloropicon primus]UPR01456.1 putative methyltransferase [Chloropicon primus]|eukprot:QDZ22238.1 putative methyltransferase [Chloropicon primus]